jgi:hypothetical protein
MDKIGDIQTSNKQINKTPNKMTITSQIGQGISIRSTYVNIELHRSLNNALITKIGMGKKILDVLFLGNKKSIRGRRNLTPKKVAKRTKIRHKKLLTKMSLDKDNVLRIIASNYHVVDIQNKESPTTRREVHK